VARSIAEVGHQIGVWNGVPRKWAVRRFGLLVSAGRGMLRCEGWAGRCGRRRSVIVGGVERIAASRLQWNCARIVRGVLKCVIRCDLRMGKMRRESVFERTPCREVRDFAV
jgi:hypothetical protein